MLFNDYLLIISQQTENKPNLPTGTNKITWNEPEQQLAKSCLKHFCYLYKCEVLGILSLFEHRTQHSHVSYSAYIQLDSIFYVLRKVVPESVFVTRIPCLFIFCTRCCSGMVTKLKWKRSFHFFKVVLGSVLIVAQNMNKREIYLQVGNVQFRHVTCFVVLYPAPEA